MNKIVLASASPRRKQLLEWANISFEIIVKETDETFPNNLGFDEVAIHIAKNKGLAVKNSLSEERTIVAADTIVVCNNEVLGKPVSKQNAIDILSKLQNNTHQVITGVVILSGEKIISFADTTEVIFHPLTQKQIEFYVDNYKPYDKAGAYAIQEWIGVVGIKSISGDFYNVMGLPVSRLVQELERLGI